MLETDSICVSGVFASPGPASEPQPKTLALVLRPFGAEEYLTAEGNVGGELEVEAELSALDVVAGEFLSAESVN